MLHTEDIWDNLTQYVLKIPVVWAVHAVEQMIAGTITESNEVLDKCGLHNYYALLYNLNTAKLQPKMYIHFTCTWKELHYDNIQYKVS